MGWSNKASWKQTLGYYNSIDKRIKKFIPSSQYSKIYQSLFVSLITDTIAWWGGIYPSKLQKLFGIQKRCLRIIFGETLSFDHSEY